MISERSTGRRVSAWLLAIYSTTHFAVAFATSKMASALARNPLSDRFL